MICSRCKAEIPDGSKFCNLCGKKLVRDVGGRIRGNGEGSAYQLPNKKWRAVITQEYYLDDDGKKKRRTKTKSGFATKKEALAYLPTLRGDKKREKKITFKQLYDKWQPTHQRGKSTMNCYSAAMNYFKPLWYCQVSDIDIDDLQECVDECPKGKRTRENMKALAGLLYKFGIPRGCIPDNLNLGKYIKVGGGEVGHKAAFTPEEVEKIKKGAEDGVAYSEYLYSLIYLGFRPSEFLVLDAKNYNRTEKAFIGGAKTEAGTDRTVTVSPKIQPIIDRLTENKIGGSVFCDKDGESISLKDFRENYFYPTLEALKIDNPTTKVDGKDVHKYTPHSCRHTFATLIKNVTAPDKDKLELIGHTSEEMLRYYQDVRFEDLRRITDAI